MVDSDGIRTLRWAGQNDSTSTQLTTLGFGLVSTSVRFKPRNGQTSGMFEKVHHGNPILHCVGL